MSGSHDQLGRPILLGTSQDPRCLPAPLIRSSGCPSRFSASASIFSTIDGNYKRVVNHGTSDSVRLCCYSDRNRHDKLLEIVQKRYADWDNVYHVSDLTRKATVGCVSRREWKSLIQSRWDVANTEHKVLASVEEQYLPLSCLRCAIWMLPAPRYYRLLASDNTELGRFRYFGQTLHASLRMSNSEGRTVVDQRLILAAALLLCVADAPGDTDVN